MKFFKKELCKKLLKLGCVSESDMFHWFGPGIDGEHLLHRSKFYPDDYLENREGNLPAFSIYDFLSDEEYCKENCKKVFGEKEHPGAWSFDWENERHRWLDSENQEAFIEEAVERLNERK